MKSDNLSALLRIYWALVPKDEARSQQGFTITELLVASTIGIIVILGKEER